MALIQYDQGPCTMVGTPGELRTQDGSGKAQGEDGTCRPRRKGAGGTSPAHTFMEDSSHQDYDPSLWRFVTIA